MSIEFKSAETYRDDYTFRNSALGIARFPFPFFEDKYEYTMNLEPHVSVPGGIYEANFDVDEHYIAEMKERAIALAEAPGQHFVSLPNTLQAQWDLLELIMQSYAADYPQYFSLKVAGARWSWENKLLDIGEAFTFGDPKTLPYSPMEYITRQAQGEWIIVDDRDDTLYWSAGMATQRADYSLRFNLGMSWKEWHGPTISSLHESGILDRGLKFLKRMRVGHPVRRLNWNFTVNPRLETAAESLPLWAPDRAKVTLDNVGEKVHMRVELQPLHRLPRSNAIVFPIRTYLASLDELVTRPKWARRMHRVLRDLNPALSDYKGFTLYRDIMVEWLSRFDDGEPTSPGNAPD
jgi:hypothetical protein